MQNAIEPESAADRAAARRPSIGLWEWLSLYVAGAFLIFFVVAHVVAVHYLGPIGSFTHEQLVEKLKQPAYLVLDLGLLVFVFYHGLAGIRRVVIDLEILGSTGLKAFTIFLLLVGIVGVYFGIRIFIAFKV